MSSAILYVAIVAIWIGVLVPRWLHHDGAATGTGLRRLSRHFSGSRPAADPDPQAGHEPGGRAGFDPEGRPRYTSFVPPEPEQDAPASPSKLQVHHEEHVSSPASGNSAWFSPLKLTSASNSAPVARSTIVPAADAASGRVGCPARCISDEMPFSGQPPSKLSVHLFDALSFPAITPRAR